jgi:small conductance mechanosensitive channel
VIAPPSPTPTPAEAAASAAKYALPEDPANLAEWTGWLEANGIDLALDVAKVLVLLFGAWLLSRWVSGAIRRRAERAKRLDPTLTIFFSNLVRWAILAFAFVATLGIFGIETTSFAALIAAVGLAVSLGFQGTLGHLAAGVMLLVFRPFKVGDAVKIGGNSGTVREIELFATVIDTPDNRRLIVPNGAVFGSTIENMSHNPMRRVDVVVGTAYDADLERTREILLAAATALPQRIADRDPVVVLDELAASSVNWSIRVWVATSDVLAGKDALLAACKKALDAASIGIPFPQVEVHMATGSAVG